VIDHWQVLTFCWELSTQMGNYCEAAPQCILFIEYAWKRSQRPEAMRLVLSYAYWLARGEILRPFRDEPQRKRLTGASLSIKNEGAGNKDDQIPL